MQKYLFWPVLIFLAIGWVYPIIGVLALFVAPIPPLFAMTRGRYWCGNYCPNGSMYEQIAGKFSKHRPIPKIFTNIYFRITVLIVFISIFAWRLSAVWGNWPDVGKLLIIMITAGSVTFIIAGMLLHERLWCAICPFGTMGKLVNPTPQVRVYVKNSCDNCGKCDTVCPLNIAPSQYKGNPDGITDADCMKCTHCQKACPLNAIEIK